jgi:hypothetical protein
VNTIARLRQPVGEAVLPFLAARAVVLGALGLAHFVVDRTHPSTAGVGARVHEGLLGWDAGYYETIARVGYHPLGREGLRFFPPHPPPTHPHAAPTLWPGCPEWTTARPCW